MSKSINNNEERVAFFCNKCGKGYTNVKRKNMYICREGLCCKHCKNKDYNKKKKVDKKNVN